MVEYRWTPATHVDDTLRGAMTGDVVGSLVWFALVHYRKTQGQEPML